MLHGTIKKVYDQWEVECTLVLHDDSVKHIEELSKRFDNIDARIQAFPFVEFEVKDGMALVQSLLPNEDYPAEGVFQSTSVIKFDSQEAMDIFFDALDQPEEPSVNLVEAAKKYTTTVSALDWFYNQTVVEGKTNYAELLEQAKQMEEQQIRAAWTDGHCLGSNGLVVVDYYNGQEYYNKNYNNEI